MNLLELKYVELSGKIVLLEEKNKELFKRWNECKHIFDINEMKIISERIQLKAELKAIENQLNVTNQIEEVK